MKTLEGGVSLDITGCPDCVLSAVEYHDEHLGFDRLEIEHDGTARWIDMQKTKNVLWGRDAITFEMQPPQDVVVNGESTEFHYRHLWKWDETRMGPWPNIRIEDI